jgi:hypothetical protein
VRRVLTGIVLMLFAAFLSALDSGFDFANPIPAVNSGVGFQAPASLSTLLKDHPTVMTPARFTHKFLSHVTLDGQGQTIALIEETPGGFMPRAMKAFDQAFGLPAPFIAQFCTFQTCRHSNSQAASVEIMLDSEWAHVVAPGARIAIVYWSPRLGSSTLEDVLSRLDPAAISISYGVTGNLAMARLRLPFLASSSSAYRAFADYPTFAAAGDEGQGASLPAMTPWITAVGGIEYSAVHHSFSPWPGSGSGVADFAYGRPSWQPNTAGPWRAIPDVSWLAGPPGVVIRANTWLRLGGTSLAAPLWAALIALVDEYRAHESKEPLTGCISPLLYRLKAEDPKTFHGFGTSEFNPTVGLGFPVPSQLIPALASSPIPDQEPRFSILSGWQIADAIGIAGLLTILLVGAIRFVWNAIRGKKRYQHSLNGDRSASGWPTYTLAGIAIGIGATMAQSSTTPLSLLLAIAIVSAGAILPSLLSMAKRHKRLGYG